MRDRKMVFVLIVGVLLGGVTFLLLQGRGATPPSAEPSNAPQGAAAVTPGGSSRVIVLSPALTEVVYAMGAQDRVVGVSDFCVYPPEVAALPSCGGIINPSYEVMESLKPDLVVVQGISDTITEYTDAAGIPTLDVPLDSLEDVLAAVDTLGEALGAEESAARLGQRMRTGLEEVRSATAGRDRPRVFISTGRSPGKLKDMMTAGAGSFLDDLITLAGGENVFGGTGGLWPSPALEALVASQPEVIIDILPNQTLDSASVERAVAEWQALGDSVPAIREGRVCVTGEDSLLIPGPRVVETARALAALIHPELTFDG